MEFGISARALFGTPESRSDVFVFRFCRTRLDGAWKERVCSYRCRVVHFLLFYVSKTFRFPGLMLKTIINRMHVTLTPDIDARNVNSMTKWGQLQFHGWSTRKLTSLTIELAEEEQSPLERDKSPLKTNMSPLKRDMGPLKMGDFT